ncbi:MAG TPA: hypothetical protein VNM90_22900 [Haliangium sp.]|nr:hypothetical protein [Haliangium sp.]
MAKMSVQVQNWSDNAAHVVSSLDENFEALVQGLMKRNAALPVGQQIDEEVIRMFARWLGSTLEHQTGSMIAAEMAYIEEQADDPAVRERRDAAASPLAVCVTRTRNRVSTVLGDAGLSAYGLKELVPRTATELAEYARVAMTLLLADSRQVPDGTGGILDTAVLAASIGMLHAPLDEALRDLRKEQRQLEAAMLRRDTEVSEWRLVYVDGATAFASLYRMAGHPGLAARVRPTTRRAEGREPAPGNEVPDDGVILPEDPGAPEAPPAVEP